MKNPPTAVGGILLFDTVSALRGIGFIALSPAMLREHTGSLDVRPFAWSYEKIFVPYQPQTN